MAEMLQAIIKIGNFTPTGPVDPKFQVDNLSYGIKIWTYLYHILSQCTLLKD